MKRCVYSMIDRVHTKKGHHQSSWLRNHLNHFVQPILGFIPTLEPSSHTRFFTPQEMSVIKNMWRTVKRESLNRPILLAGRDVFIFYVLAMREGYDKVTFRPDISRGTVNHIKEDYKGYYLFDTGFLGSIPKGLKISHYTMASSDKTMSPDSLIDYFFLSRQRERRRQPLRNETNQVFPRMRGSRSLALKIESTPKYWKTAFYRDPRYQDSIGALSHAKVDPKTGIGQEFSDFSTFEAAARLTIEVYTDNSPKFTERQLTGYKR